MTLLKDFTAELVGMFVGDVPLTLALLGLVAIAAALIHLVGVEPLAAGALLLVGCLVLLVSAVQRGSRNIRKPF
jgi:hypothetical protein